jgi:hypothetical protein
MARGRARTFDFDALPLPVRERFVASANGRFPPRPVLHVGAPAPMRRSWAWAPLALALVAGVLLFRFGVPGQARQSHLIVAPIAALLLVALRAVASRERVARLPYRDGWYVFPTTVVRAEGARLSQWSREALALSAVGSQVRATLGGRAAFEIESFDDASAEELVDSLGSQAPVSSSGVFDARGDAALFDPLAPVPDVDGVRVSPKSVPPPPSAAWSWLAAGVAALATAGALHIARDDASDERAFARVCALDTAGGYRAYLRDGARHRAEVTEQRAPRAELREALADGSLSALERFAAARPGFGHEEIERARQGLLLGELSTASASLGGLASFAQKHPEHSLAAEIALARRSLYDAAARRLSVGTQTPAARVQVALLLDARDRGLPVRVRFAGATSELTGGDRLLMASPRFGGNAYLPSALPQGALLDDALAEGALAALRTRLGEPMGELVTFRADAGEDAKKPGPALTLRAHVELDGGLLLDATAPALPALRFRFEWAIEGLGDASPSPTSPTSPTVRPVTSLATTVVHVRRTCLGKPTAQRAPDAYRAMARIALTQAVAALFEAEPALVREHEC